MAGRGIQLAALAATCWGCAAGPPRTTATVDAKDLHASAGRASSTDPLEALRKFENTKRERTDFAHLPPSDTTLGADPYVVQYASPHLLGLLRGRSALVELDGSLHEVSRLPAPRSPTGMAIAGTGEVFVVGELSSRIARYRPGPGGRALVPAGSVELSDVRAMRDIAAGPEGVLYVVEEHGGRLLTVRPHADAGDQPPAARRETVLCHGPLHVARTLRWVMVDCLLDHAVVVRAVDAEGFPLAQDEARIEHDGPMWGMDALAEGNGLLVAVGGVEDHPLDRTEGSFGFVDSFVTLYRIEDGRAEKLGEVNTSAIGVVTPKALRLSRSPRSARSPGGVELAVAGYGSDHLAVLHWNGAVDGAPAVTTIDVPPGTAQMAACPDGSLVLANPLLDAWVRVPGAGPVDIVHVEDAASEARGAASRLGEGLFFTTLIAPWDRSEGRLSRFTCETCHFEGYVDGRTHHTGRGDIRATTKPLIGLFNNRPHFSRALDPDLTTMVNNEFRVAGARSDRDPGSRSAPGDLPWKRDLLVRDETLTPVDLRPAMMSFFMDFTHRPNPGNGRDAPSWTGAERAGADVFRSRCESCHEARVVADNPATRVDPSEWEQRVLAPEGAIVWAHEEYAKTGVTPYVNEKGARVPSLRRLYKKHPYFTNGSAAELSDVLDRARFSVDGGFFHEGGPQDARSLSSEEKASLAAFLDLL